jgi:hypothetical protein
MAGAVVELLGWPGGNIRVGVALCWINPLRPIQFLFVFPLLHPSRGKFPSDNLLSSQNRSTIPKGRPSHQRPQMRYITFHPIKNPSDCPFRSGPSPTPVFEWITLTRSHPLFRLWCFLHLLARLSPSYAHYATSEATEKGKEERRVRQKWMSGVPAFESLTRIFSPVVARSRSGIFAIEISSTIPVPVPWLEENPIVGCSRTKECTATSPHSCWSAFLPHTVPFHSFMHVPIARVILFLGIVSYPFACVTRRPNILFSSSLAITCALPIMTCVLTPLGAPVVRVCLTLKRVPTSGIWRCGSTTGFFLSPITQMRRFLKNKIKGEKSPKPPQPGFPTQIADRPPGFPTEPSITPKGVRSLFYRDRGVD